jgi:hypothetical protein
MAFQTMGSRRYALPTLVLVAGRDFPRAASPAAAG